MATEAVDAWTPTSWRSKPIKQQPEYPDEAALKRALDKVSSLPPLVHPREVDTLKADLAACIRGEAFLLQGGDCAERFLDCNRQAIEHKFKILLQMSLVILFTTHKRVVRVARMAGQFAKPRSAPMEKLKDGREVYSFKGDNVNSIDVDHRTPDPDRMVQAYFHSAACINYVRAMIAGGVADLHDPTKWNMKNVLEENLREGYESIIDRLTDAFALLRSIDASSSQLKTIDFFTSHEALLLNYEEALTRDVMGSFYNLSAHMIWIGDRTRGLGDAHVEYFRGITNPVGCKVGPSMSADELKLLVQTLNPHKEPGKLTLITRYGASNVEKCLPGHLAAVRETGVPVLWSCDPCHGNTESTADGIKTRDFSKVIRELELCFTVHAANGSRLMGAHLEMTGDDVTECVGGSHKLTPAHLSTNYETFCDPRLNYTQSLDAGFLIAKMLKDSTDRKLEDSAQENARKLKSGLSFINLHYDS